MKARNNIASLLGLLLLFAQPAFAQSSTSEKIASKSRQWSRMQMKRGKLRRVDTEAIQTETWVNTKDGWKLKHIGDVKPGAWYVDGKRIDPSKPYDPDAPEYRPQ